MRLISNGFKKWLGRILIAVLALVFLAMVIVFVGSEFKLRRNYDIALNPITVPVDSASIKEGQRLEHIFHCSGCHGERLAGKVFFTVPNVATIVAPNISESMPTYTDAELARLIRHGINRNGRGVWMPVSAQFYHVSDDDLGNLIAYLRTVPKAESAIKEETSIGLLGRIGVMTGEFVYPASLIDHQAVRIKKDTSSLVLGKYYAQTVCATCHGNDLKGTTGPGPATPSLIVAKAYKSDQFISLMKNGEGVARKDLGLMSIMSRYHFKHFTDHEIKSIHDYLKTME